MEPSDPILAARLDTLREVLRHYEACGPDQWEGFGRYLRAYADELDRYLTRDARDPH